MQLLFKVLSYQSSLAPFNSDILITLNSKYPLAHQARLCSCCMARSQRSASRLLNTSAKDGSSESRFRTAPVPLPSPRMMGPDGCRGRVSELWTSLGWGRTLDPADVSPHRSAPAGEWSLESFGEGHHPLERPRGDGGSGECATASLQHAVAPSCWRSSSS
jgi:hypothetical protein